MSDEIQQNRYDQILRRVAGIIGPGSKVSQVITELFPMINVEDLPAELLLLGGTQICFGGGFIAADVAEGPTGQLFNPAGSNALITVTSVFLATNQTTIIGWGVVPVERGARISTETFRDTRNAVPNRPVGQIRQDSAVAFADGTNQIRQLTNDSFTLHDPNGICVLAPGTGFEIGARSVNTQFNFSIFWRERPALPSELNL